MLPSGSVLEHAMFQLLEAVLTGDSGAMWGLLYALQQRCPVPDTPAATAATATTRRLRPQQQQMKQRAAVTPALVAPAAAAAAAAGDAVPGGAGFAGFGCGSSLVAVRPLVGPSWRQFKLPYSAYGLSW
jgi:hypothetical protein